MSVDLTSRLTFPMCRGRGVLTVSVFAIAERLTASLTNTLGSSTLFIFTKYVPPSSASYCENEVFAALELAGSTAAENAPSERMSMYIPSSTPSRPPHLEHLVAVPPAVYQVKGRDGRGLEHGLYCHYYRIGRG